MSTPASAPEERYQLFQRSGSTRWQVRFSIRGQGQFKRSLDTDDRREAERRADAVWYEATYRAKQGLTAEAHTFEGVAEEYIAQILREVERRERRAEASAGTSEVTANVASVAGAAETTGAAASEVLGSASALADQSAVLGAAMKQFLSRLQAA